MCCQEEERFNERSECLGCRNEAQVTPNGQLEPLRKSLPQIASLARFQFRKMTLASMWERNQKGSLLPDEATLHWHLLPNLPQTYENSQTKIKIICRIHRTEEHSTYRKAGHSRRGVHEPSPPVITTNKPMPPAWLCISWAFLTALQRRKCFPASETRQ